MPVLSKLRQARQEILAQIAFLEEMRRGSVIRQFLKIKLKGKRKPALSGPYALLTFKQKGKTVSRRLHDLEEIRRLEQQVENYHSFQHLCRRLVEIGEAICQEKEKGR
jgi:Family of unknown function (DUF6788)